MASGAWAVDSFSDEESPQPGVPSTQMGGNSWRQPGRRSTGATGSNYGRQRTNDDGLLGQSRHDHSASTVEEVSPAKPPRNVYRSGSHRAGAGTMPPAGAMGTWPGEAVATDATGPAAPTGFQSLTELPEHVADDESMAQLASRLASEPQAQVATGTLGQALQSGTSSRSSQPVGFVAAASPSSDEDSEDDTDGASLDLTESALRKLQAIQPAPDAEPAPQRALRRELVAKPAASSRPSASKRRALPTAESARLHDPYRHAPAPQEPMHDISTLAVVGGEAGGRRMHRLPRGELLDAMGLDPIEEEHQSRASSHQDHHHQYHHEEEEEAEEEDVMAGVAALLMSERQQQSNHRMAPRTAAQRPQRTRRDRATTTRRSDPTSDGRALVEVGSASMPAARGSRSKALAVMTAMHAQYARAVKRVKALEQAEQEAGSALRVVQSREKAMAHSTTALQLENDAIRAKYKTLKSRAKQVMDTAAEAQAAAREWQRRAQQLEMGVSVAKEEATRNATRAVTAEREAVEARERAQITEKTALSLRETLLSSQGETARLRESESSQRRVVAEAESRLRSAEASLSERVESARKRGAEYVAAEMRSVQRELSEVQSRLEREREIRYREVGEAERRSSEAEETANARLAKMRQQLARVVAERDDAQTELAQLAVVAAEGTSDGIGATGRVRGKERSLWRDTGLAKADEGSGEEEGEEEEMSGVSIRVRLRHRLEEAEAGKRRAEAELRTARSDLEEARGSAGRSIGAMRAERDEALSRVERSGARVEEAERAMREARADANEARSRAETAGGDVRAELEGQVEKAKAATRTAEASKAEAEARLSAAESDGRVLKDRIRALALLDARSSTSMVGGLGSSTAGDGKDSGAAVLVEAQRGVITALRSDVESARAAAARAERRAARAEAEAAAAAAGGGRGGNGNVRRETAATQGSAYMSTIDDHVKVEEDATDSDATSSSYRQEAHRVQQELALAREASAELQAAKERVEEALGRATREAEVAAHDAAGARAAVISAREAETEACAARVVAEEAHQTIESRVAGLEQEVGRLRRAEGAARAVADRETARAEEEAARADDAIAKASDAVTQQSRSSRAIEALRRSAVDATRSMRSQARKTRQHSKALRADPHDVSDDASSPLATNDDESGIVSSGKATDDVQTLADQLREAEEEAREAVMELHAVAGAVQGRQQRQQEHGTATTAAAMLAKAEAEAMIARQALERAEARANASEQAAIADARSARGQLDHAIAQRDVALQRAEEAESRVQELETTLLQAQEEARTAAADAAAAKKHSHHSHRSHHRESRPLEAGNIHSLQPPPPPPAHSNRSHSRGVVSHGETDEQKSASPPTHSARHLQLPSPPSDARVSAMRQSQPSLDQRATAMQLAAAAGSGHSLGAASRGANESPHAASHADHHDDERIMMATSGDATSMPGVSRRYSPNTTADGLRSEQQQIEPPTAQSELEQESIDDMHMDEHVRDEQAERRGSATRSRRQAVTEPDSEVAEWDSPVHRSELDGSHVPFASVKSPGLRGIVPQTGGAVLAGTGHNHPGSLSLSEASGTGYGMASPMHAGEGTPASASSQFESIASSSLPVMSDETSGPPSSSDRRGSAMSAAGGIEGSSDDTAMASPTLQPRRIGNSQIKSITTDPEEAAVNSPFQANSQQQTRPQMRGMAAASSNAPKPSLPPSTGVAAAASAEPIPDPTVTAMTIATTQLQSALARQQHASDDLCDADPRALITLSKASKISDHMAVVAGALCLLLGCDPTWAHAQTLLAKPEFAVEAARVSDEDVEPRSLRKVTQLVKSKGLREFVKRAASKPESLSDVEGAERLLAAWVISVADTGVARKAVRKTSKRQLREAAAAATASEGPISGATAGGSAGGSGEAVHSRLARRSSSLRRLRRAEAPTLMEPVEEGSSREEHGSVSNRTPRAGHGGSGRSHRSIQGSVGERESVGSARSASAKRIQRDTTSAAKASASASASAARGDESSADAGATAMGFPAPRPIEASVAIEALEKGLFVLWFNPNSGWFAKKSEEREVWLHRSPAADAIAWAPPGSKRAEPKHKLLLRDIKRVGFGLLTPTLEKNGDHSQPELHVVVQAGGTDQLEVLTRNVSERDVILAAVGHLIASRR